MGSLPKDFKSFASADFAILAYLCIVIQFLFNAKDFKSLVSACSAIRAYHMVPYWLMPKPPYIYLFRITLSGVFVNCLRTQCRRSGFGQHALYYLSGNLICPQFVHSAT